MMITNSLIESRKITLHTERDTFEIDVRSKDEIILTINGVKTEDVFTDVTLTDYLLTNWNFDFDDISLVDGLLTSAIVSAKLESKRKSLKEQERILEPAKKCLDVDKITLDDIEKTDKEEEVQSTMNIKLKARIRRNNSFLVKEIVSELLDDVIQEIESMIDWSEVKSNVIRKCKDDIPNIVQDLAEDIEKGIADAVYEAIGDDVYDALQDKVTNDKAELIEELINDFVDGGIG